MSDLTTDTASVRSQIEALYETFQRYSVRAVMPANCSCCEPFADENLTAKPLKELSSSDLLDYFYLAVNNVGDENDFRHFLPRMLESFVIEEKPYFARQVMIDHLKKGGCLNWPSTERAALITFFHAIDPIPRLKKLACGALEMLESDVY